MLLGSGSAHALKRGRMQLTCILVLLIFHSKPDLKYQSGPCSIFYILIVVFNFVLKELEQCEYLPVMSLGLSKIAHACVSDILKMSFFKCKSQSAQVSKPFESHFTASLTRCFNKRLILRTKVIIQSLGQKIRQVR